MSLTTRQPGNFKEIPKEPTYVRWCGGYWKIVSIDLFGPNPLLATLRWVYGDRPDAGVFQTVKSHDYTIVNEMETIALLLQEDAVP